MNSVFSRVSSRGVVYGVGVNDSTHPVRKTKTVEGKITEVWGCPYYKVWIQMLYRCYSPAYKRKYKHTYSATVCTDWLKFTNFRVWMENQEWEGKQLDKDILISGNTEYGPDACEFVNQHLNKFFNTRSNVDKKFLMGTRKNNRGRRYTACITRGTKTVSLGGYDSEEDAHFAWLEQKTIDLSKFIGQNSGRLDNRLVKVLNHLRWCVSSRTVFKTFKEIS